MVEKSNICRCNCIQKWIIFSFFTSLNTEDPVPVGYVNASTKQLAYNYDTASAILHDTPMQCNVGTRWMGRCHRRMHWTERVTVQCTSCAAKATRCSLCLLSTLHALSQILKLDVPSTWHLASSEFQQCVYFNGFQATIDQLNSVACASLMHCSLFRLPMVDALILQ